MATGTAEAMAEMAAAAVAATMVATMATMITRLLVATTATTTKTKTAQVVMNGQQENRLRPHLELVIVFQNRLRVFHGK